MLTEELIKTHEISEEAVKAIQGHYDTEVIPGIKKETETAAIANAEKMLAGAAELVEKKTGVPREQGQKLGDYFGFAGSKFFESKEAELAQKLKDASKGGDEALRKRNEELEVAFNDYKKLQVEHEEILPFKEKYQTLQKENSEFKQNAAFNSVKPKIPDGVNQYEFDHKWNTLRRSVLEKYNLVEVDGQWKAVDKENEHRQKPLTDLVSDDKDISELLQERQQEGLGGKKKPETTKIEGVPFDVPVNASREELSKTIHESIAKEFPNLMQTSPEYEAKFRERWTAVRKGQK